MSSTTAVVTSDLRRYVYEALKVWAPDYPRQVGRTQESAESADDALSRLMRDHGRDAGFISVYSFPRGHSTNGNVPKVDTLMFDFDIPCVLYKSEGDRRKWETEMAGLLAAVRRVVEYLTDMGKVGSFRFSLSGHKGVHMYLDFEPVHPANGSLVQFKRGLGDYSEHVIEILEDGTGIDLDPWLDVDSSDMGRLTRCPNTLHDGATEAFGVDRYCVPVTPDELLDMTPERYWELTSQPRAIPREVQRSPSQQATKTVSRFVQVARSSRSSTQGEHVGEIDVDQVLDEYDAEANEGYDSLEDIWLFVADRPCIREFFEMDTPFDHGNQSHVMELFVMTRLVNLGVPSDVIVDFFRDMDGFTEWDTRFRVAQVAARNYADFNCETIWSDAPRFCIENRCNIYERSH